MTKKMTNKPLLTSKQTILLSNLADAPGSKVCAIRKHAIADFKSGNPIHTKDYVAASMLTFLAKRGYCYSKKASSTAARIWYPTELGILILLNVVGENYGNSRNY